MSAKKGAAKGATVAILVGVFCFTGLAAYVVNGPAFKVPEAEQRHEATQKPDEQTDKPSIEVSGQQKGEATQVKVLKPTYENGELTFKESTTTVAQGSDAIITAVNEYLDQIPAVDKEARLIGLETHGGIITLKFSPKFEAGYGTDDEKSIVVGILTTLGQFPEIKKAQFTIEGRQLESLGSIDLTEPQDVIR